MGRYGRCAGALIISLLPGCPGDDSGDEGAETGSASNTSPTGPSTTGPSTTSPATTSPSATSPSTTGPSTTSDTTVATGNTTLPPSCVGAGEDGPDPTVCPNDVGCEVECEIDGFRCCEAGMNEWTCECPDPGGTASGGADSMGDPCLWTSPTCGG